MFIYTIKDILAVGFFASAIVGFLCFLIFTKIKQHFCRHKDFRKYSNAETHCLDCGKDLRFYSFDKKTTLPGGGE